MIQICIIQILLTEPVMNNKSNLRNIIESMRAWVHYTHGVTDVGKGTLYNKREEKSLRFCLMNKVRYRESYWSHKSPWNLKQWQSNEKWHRWERVDVLYNMRILIGLAQNKLPYAYLEAWIQQPQWPCSFFKEQTDGLLEEPLKQELLSSNLQTTVSQISLQRTASKLISTDLMLRWWSNHMWRINDSSTNR